MSITDKELELLRYARQRGTVDQMDLTVDFSSKGYSKEEIAKFIVFVRRQKWIEKDNSGNDILNKKCLDFLESIDIENERKNKGHIDANNKQLNLKWWDRIIDNGYKLITVPILFWTAILQYNQLDNSDDIEKLQAKLKQDSIQFLTTLRALENQSSLHDSMLQKTNTYILKYDSLLNTLKVDKQTKKK